MNLAHYQKQIHIKADSHKTVLNKETTTSE